MASHTHSIFLDRENERCRLREAILSGRSLMITGARGMGKTALVLKVIAELTPSVRRHCLYVETYRDPQDLLRRLIRVLLKAESPSLSRELRTAGVATRSSENWLTSLSSSRLQGTLYRAVQEDDRYRIFLDHGHALTPSVGRVIKELIWMRRTPVYLVADGTRTTEMEIVGASQFSYRGDEQILQLGPLPYGAARTLIEACIQECGLAGLDLEGFREELSQLAPGAIVTMCEMAAHQNYQFHSRVKTKLIHIDYLMRGSARTAKRT